MRAVRGARGWQPQPARANCLALQLSRLTEPPSCPGATPTAPITLPHEHNPAPSTPAPAPSQTQTYRFSHSLPGA